MQQRIYIDNSVIGGYYDDEFQEDTRLFFKQIENGEFYVYFSDINEAELSLAPDNIRELKNKIPKDYFNSVNLKLGYPTIDIRTPTVMIHYED